VWTVVATLGLGTFMAASFDVAEGYPGAGVWALAYLAPATVIPVGITDIRVLAPAYGLCSLIYIVWCIAFGILRGMGPRLMHADGGNLMSIIAALVVETTPYFSVAYVFVIAREYTAFVVRDRVVECVRAVARVEADHELATRAARV